MTPKRGSQNTNDGTVPSAEVTCANHLAPLCDFHVCGLCAANRAYGDPETERVARTSNQGLMNLPNLRPLRYTQHQHFLNQVGLLPQLLEYG